MRSTCPEIRLSPKPERLFLFAAFRDKHTFPRQKGTQARDTASAIWEGFYGDGGIFPVWSSSRYCLQPRPRGPDSWHLPACIGTAPPTLLCDRLAGPPRMPAWDRALPPPALVRSSLTLSREEPSLSEARFVRFQLCLIILLVDGKL